MWLQLCQLTLWLHSAEYVLVPRIVHNVSSSYKRNAMNVIGKHELSEGGITQTKNSFAGWWLPFPCTHTHTLTHTHTHTHTTHTRTTHTTHTHTHTHAHTKHTHTHTHTLSQFYPDRAVQRDVMDILVKCVNHNTGCPWTGQLKNWEVRKGRRML